MSFRKDRFDEVMRIEAFHTCKEEALALDAKARTRDSSGAYITSARVMTKCETQLGTDPRGVSVDERMRLSALSVVNYMKGGDSESARTTLIGFKNTFPERDLYFADGSSFIETTELLLGQRETVGFGTFSTMNVSGDVKNEMRRIQHWKNK